MLNVKEKIAAELEDTLGVEVDRDDIEIPDAEHGDFAYPAMKAAAELGESPRKVAEDASEELEEKDIIEKVEVAGPGYLNFHLVRSRYAEIVEEGLEEEDMGVEQREGSVLLEFSSPNVAKPMHVGHFRNNALGDSLQRIMRFVGYDVTSENYIGDWGTQYGKLIYAYKKYGSEEKFEEAPMEHMFELYVRFHEEAEEDEEIDQEGQEWAKKVEEGDEEARRLWKMFRDASIEYHEQEYERMGIEFDRVTGESTVVEETEALLEKGVEEGTLERDDDGSIYVEFDDEDLPSTVLKKADGSTLYLSRDLENLRKRKEDEGFDYNMYVVGSEQNLHFQQLFAIADKFGIDTDGCEHISYGMLRLPEGSMSSRKGRIIRLSDVMDEAEKRAEEKIKDRDVDAASEIGIGAVKYANLSVSKNKDIEFNWDSVLSFEGDSGPYLQYSNTRAKSILEKTEKGEFGGEFDDREYRLLKKIAEFPERVGTAAEQREPAKIATYLSELCEEFNSFYHARPVIGEDETTEKRRTRLVELFVQTTDQGLELLGIEPLEKM